MDSKEYLENAKEILLSILKMTPTAVVGVDIGQNAVKMVEAEVVKNEIRVNRFAYELFPEGCIIEDEILQEELVINTIKQCYAKGGFRNKQVCIGLSGPNTMSKRLQLIDGTEQELADQVLWESEQYIPFGAEESTISFSVLGRNPNGGTHVMIAAAKNSMIESFLSVLKKADLKPRLVDLDLFAYANLFEFYARVKSLPDELGVLLLDVGAQKTNIIIMHKHSVVFTRELAIGGIIITEEIQRNMSLSYNEAEDLKINGDQNGNLPEEIVEIIEISLDGFFSELKKTLTFFMTASGDIAVNTCFITGGGALTPGLIEGVEKNLSIEVHHFNPLEVVKNGDKKISEQDIDYMAATGCVAIGLAIRKMKV